MNAYLERVIDLDWQAQPAEIDFAQRCIWLVEQDILPRTVALFEGLLTGMSDLRYTLYECARRQDLAGAKVVSQALVEQYLRFQYLLHRQFANPQEGLTQRYVDAQVIQGVMVYWQAEYATRQNPAKPPFTLGLIWPQLVDEQPQLAGYDLEQAQALINEFNWTAIKHHLAAAKARDKRGLTTDLLLHHACCECWGQGGPLRDYALRSYRTEAQQVTELNKMCSLALKLTLGAKTFCCYLYEPYQDSFTQIRKKLWPLVLALETLETVTTHAER